MTMSRYTFTSSTSTRALSSATTVTCVVYAANVKLVLLSHHMYSVRLVGEFALSRMASTFSLPSAAATNARIGVTRLKMMHRRSVERRQTMNSKTATVLIVPQYRSISRSSKAEAECVKPAARLKWWKPSATYDPQLVNKRTGVCVERESGEDAG
ncbi:hypothetical protein AB1Y20_018894 [Prymnesium parvum]|uniref:Secreted protein n=1 Tax=Prymnesium parvum TaxID=97485 RepID=A0AB34JPH0_PRYPA